MYMSDTEVSEITTTLNELLASVESIGGSSGGSSGGGGY